MKKALVCIFITLDNKEFVMSLLTRACVYIDKQRERVSECSTKADRHTERQRQRQTDRDKDTERGGRERGE